MEEPQAASSEELDPESLLTDEPDPVLPDGEEAAGEDSVVEEAPQEQPDEGGESEEDWLAPYRESGELNVGEFDLSFIPEGMARDRARQVMGVVAERVSVAEAAAQTRADEAEIAKATYEAEAASLRSLAEKLNDDTSLQDLQEYQDVMASQKTMSTMVTATSWQAFNMAYPEWENAPLEQRERFRDLLLGNEETGEQSKIFTFGNNESTYFDRMELAWQYAAYQAGQPKPSRYAGSAAPAQKDPVQPQPQTDEERLAAARAAAIGSGGSPPAPPLKQLTDKTEQEILDEHDHFLA